MSQLRHTIYYIEVVLAFSRGARPSVDWAGSFEPTGAAAAEFGVLAARLETLVAGAAR